MNGNNESVESKKLKVALIQMDVAIGEPEANFSKAETLLEQAIAHTERPDVILLPEMWNTGYALPQIHELADRGGEQTERLISAFCRKYRVNVIAGSVSDLRGGQVYNTIYAFDRKGNRVADYSKIHLFRLMEEEKYLFAGETVGAAQIDGVSSGMMICYDIRFPELARKLALGGASVLFVPAEWPHPRLHHWRTLLQARAIENQMYVVACNRMGTSGKTDFFGHSMVVDPWGEIVVEGGEEETILHASIDLAAVDRIRRTIPVFEDRRPSLY
ncbi:MAG: nitrilase [Paenibacillaceae bacterium]|jgi:predicted amidohydrolase|nr:nitrilase [Paenibacillaceae bacterium]